MNVFAYLASCVNCPPCRVCSRAERESEALWKNLKGTEDEEKG